MTDPSPATAATAAAPARARLLRAGLLIAVLAAFWVAQIDASRRFLHQYPWSWSWSEMLVDYQGGFVKRGLLGEAAFRLQGVISPDRLVVDALAAAYLFASAGLVLALRLPARFAGLLFLASPAGGLFPLLNPAAFGRKDAFVLAALVAGFLTARSCRRPNLALAGTMAIFLVAGLLVEIAWFYYPLVAAVLLARWRERPLRWRLGAAAAAAAYTLGCLALTLLAPKVDTAAIAASWNHMPFDTDVTGALCCLNFGFAQALGIARATLPSLRGYAVAALLGTLPLALLAARRPPARVDPLAAAVGAAGLLAAAFPLAVTADWGRYIYLWHTAAFLSYWTASRDRPDAAARRPTPEGLLLRVALLALYASTWQVVHYQRLDQSALIPGLLFRRLGAPASALLPD